MPHSNYKKHSTKESKLQPLTTGAVVACKRPFRPPSHWRGWELLDWEPEERSLLLTLVHSSQLYIWAFNLRAWIVYRAHSAWMVPWRIPCGTTTSSCCWSWSSCLWVPSQRASKHLWLVKNSCSFITTWCLTLNMVTLHWLKLLRVWGLVKLSIVWALDEKACQLEVSNPHKNRKFWALNWSSIVTGLLTKPSGICFLENKRVELN